MMPNWIRWLVAIILALLLLLCFFGVFGKMGGTASLKAPTLLAVSGTPVVGQPFGLAGTGSPNSTVGLYVAGAEIGRAPVNANGEWTFPGANFASVGTQTVEVKALNADGIAATGVGSALTNVNVVAGSSNAAFLYPNENETLDAQDFILEGTGKAGENLEMFRNGTSVGTVTVDANGKWSYPVSGADTKPGEYTYELRNAGGALATRKIVVKAGQTTASNAKCPCKFRISSFTNGKVPTPNANVILYKNGAEIARGTAPYLFTQLDAGEYTYTVEAAGYKSQTNLKAVAPKNKNIPVYLAPQK